MAEEAKTAVAVGHVIDFNIPEGKSPISCYVGGVRLTWWKTIKDVEDDLFVKNPMTTKMKEIVEAKQAVKVKYEISESKSKDGSKTYTNNVPVKVATDDLDEDAIKKGDAASETAKAENAAKYGKKKDWTPRDESPVASRWAMSTALELAGEGLDLTKAATLKSVVATACKLIDGAFEVQKHAKDLWAPKDAAKGSAKAADEKPEEKDDVPF